MENLGTQNSQTLSFSILNYSPIEIVKTIFQNLKILKITFIFFKIAQSQETLSSGCFSYFINFHFDAEIESSRTL